MNKILTGCVILALAAVAPVWSAENAQEGSAVISSPSEEIVILETTEGKMVLGFFEDKAPKHVESFKKLSKEGFYDGTKFHRVIKGFMIQGGDPNTKNGDPSTWGTGGPGYKLKAEFNDIKHEKGILSMARSADPNSAGSQFFIMHGRSPHLDNQYTVFGKLVEGMDVLDKIANAPTKQRGRENSFPVDPVTIKKATVTTWGDYQKSQEK
ncbi:MAG: peptidylprolyl isomerase [bacterium]|jgi:peptidyl-prolyl cis-trans isomerase B (cyclophilin B)